MKKLLMLSLCLMLAATLAVSGTIAYLTSQDGQVNVMTLGNVNIKQQEWQRKDGIPTAYTASKADGTLVDFVQDQMLVPAVPQGSYVNDLTAAFSRPAVGRNSFYMGDYVTTADEIAVGLWFEDRIQNQMDKIVTVTNTGNSNAYVRTLLAFECPEGYTVGSKVKENDIIVNTLGGWIGQSAPYKYEEIGHVTVDGVRYYVVCATYGNNSARTNYGVVAPNETIRPSLVQVAMHPDMTNEDFAKFGSTYQIIALSQAVQADGFDTPEQGLNEAFPYRDENGNVDADVIGEWLLRTMCDAYVTSPEGLLEALETGGRIMLGGSITIEGDALTTGIASIPVAFAITEDTEIILNGHSISLPDTGAQPTAAIFVKNAELTISGEGTVTQNGTSDYVLWASSDSTLNIQGGTFEGMGLDCTTLYASGSTAESSGAINVYGGTFVNHSTDPQDWHNVYNHGKGSITYYGGTFTWDPTHVTADDKDHITVAEGYTVQNNGDGTWSVVPE